MSLSPIQTVMRSLMVIGLAGAVAHADPTPWTAGVSAQQQQRANDLFAEANDLFARQLHTAALDKYRAAIAIWDHPMLRYNMAVALIRLERYVEAAESLDGALRYGEAPFTADLYQRALTYRTFVDAHLGTIEVDCTHLGIQVFLDGAPWFACPAGQRRRVALGDHAIVAEQAGHVISSTRVTIKAGESYREHVRPPRLTDRLEYPTPRWLPWVIAGAGVATLTAGVMLRVKSGAEMDQITEDLARRCPPECDDVFGNRREAAQDKATLGASLAIGGGALALGGLAWAVLNRPRTVRTSIEVAPTNGGGIARARWQF